MNKEFAQKLIAKTTADYNRIAALWSTKRWRSPSDMMELRMILKPGDKVLDLGCGNGIFYEAIKDLGIDYTGADTSEELIKICEAKYPTVNFVLVDSFSTPFADGTFDKIFCLSVIHHIPTEELRRKFLDEARRVIKMNGTLVLSAWNIENSKMLDWWEENKEKFPEFGELEEGDLLYPFCNEKGEIEVYRYLHSFSENNIKTLLNRSGYRVETIKIISRGKGLFSNLISFSKKR